MGLLLNFVGIKYFCFLMLFSYILFMTIILYKKNKYTKLDFNEYEKSPELIIPYLDKFYIKNKYVTFLLIILYFLFKVSLILYIRYIYLGYEIYITQMSSQLMTFSIIIYLKLIFVLIIFMISLFLFNLLLFLVFFDEIMKIYIYYVNTKLIRGITYYYVTYSMCDIWGPCCLFFDCIYRATPTPNDFFYDEFYMYNNIYENNIIIKLTSYCISLSQKYKLIFMFFTLCRKFFKMLYVHFRYEGIGKYLPVFILLLTAIYDFFSHTILYLYYASFITYFIILYNNSYSFLMNQHHMFIPSLNRFFYSNTINYDEQRVYFKNNIFKFNIKSPQNLALLKQLRNDETVLKNIYNNFKDQQTFDKKTIMMYFRFFIICTFSLMNLYIIYLLKKKLIVINYSIIVALIFIVLLWLIFIFFGRNTYVLKKEDPNSSDFVTYNYNKKYEIMFWLTTLLYCYLFWFVLFKPQLVFMNDNILIQLPYDLLKITKIYSKEEKIHYLFQYFEYKLSSIDKLDYDYIRHLLRQINFNDLIHEHITLKDIQVYIQLLLDNSQYLEIFIQENNKIFLENLNKIIVEDFLEAQEKRNPLLHITKKIHNLFNK